MRRSVFLLMLIAGLFFLAGCGAPEREPAPPPEEEPALMNIAVYYVKHSETNFYLVREVHAVEQTPRVLEAAVEELIQGKPQTEGAYNLLPPEAEVREVRVNGNLATVDFSEDILQANVGSAGEALGIQSIVNTLTEFEEIERVAFEVEGAVDERTRDWWGHVGLYQQPFSRDLSSVWEPAIWVYEPYPGQQVEGDLTVRGSARVFEATVNLRLLAEDETVLEETFTTAAEGAPGRGDFQAILEDTPSTGSEGTLEVFWISPKDGSEMDKVRIPLKF